MAGCAGGRGARMARRGEERGHGVALWMVGASGGEDGGERMGARMVGAAAEAIPGTAPFHRCRAGRG
jgi:hypothetical protein